MSILAGQVGSGLDIKLYHNRVLTDPNSISYEIKEPAGTVVASGTGTKVSTGFYNASGSTIPSGYPGTSWSIVWTFTSPSNVGDTATESFTVVDSLSTSFNYDVGNIESIIEDVKLDMGLSNEFTQANYVRLIKKSLRRLNRRLRFTGTTNALSYNSSTNNITPAPNDNITDLIILQIECLISKERRRDAVGKGIRVKDGDTEIDTTASFSGHSSVVSDFCGELDDAVKEYIRHEVDSPADHAEVVWYGSRRIEGEMDHDGEGDDSVIVYTSPFEHRIGLSVHMR